MWGFCADPQRAHLKSAGALAAKWERRFRLRCLEVFRLGTAMAMPLKGSWDAPQGQRENPGPVECVRAVARGLCTCRTAGTTKTPHSRQKRGLCNPKLTSQIETFSWTEPFLGALWRSSPKAAGSATSLSR